MSSTSTLSSPGCSSTFYTLPSTAQNVHHRSTHRRPTWLLLWDCAYYEEVKQLSRKLQRRGGLGSDNRYTHHYAWTRGTDEAYGRRSFPGTILPHQVPAPSQPQCTCAQEDALWDKATTRERIKLALRRLKKRLTEI